MIEVLFISILYFALISAGNPNDDVEVISGGTQPGYPGYPGYQPGYQPTPSIPSVPNYPVVPSIPTIPSVPIYPSYHYPAYPAYTPSYLPFGWTYNIFGGFSSESF